MHFFPFGLSLLAIAGVLAETQEPLVAPESIFKQDVLTPEIDKYIEEVLASWNSPGGVGVAVVQKNEDGSWNVETKGYGNAKADGSKVTEDTLFAIGSNSKLFDVIATGLLISNESLSPRIAWNTKISSVIPEWELADPVASSESNIIDLMSHRTGLPRHDVSYNDKKTTPGVISKLKYLRPSAEFREVWQYNNLMYTVLSYLPEVLLRIPFTHYVKEHIFLPLGLHSTTYSADVAENSGNLASGFARDKVNETEDIFGMGIPRTIPFWNPRGGEDGNVISGAGGVISSSRDVATWLQTLLLLGQHPKTNEQIIPSAVILKVATGVTTYAGVASFPELGPVVYGGGQMMSSYRGHNYVEHGGSTPGFHTQITRFPFENVGVAVLSNDDAFGGLFIEVIKGRIIDKMFGLEPIDWNSNVKQLATIRYEEQLRSLVPRPTHPSPPSVHFASFAGEYHHPAYGSLLLCGLSSTVSSPENPECQDLIDKLPTQLPDTVNASVPTFFSRMESAWLSHVRLEHFSGNLFNVSGFLSLPILEPSKTSMQEQRYWARDSTGHAPITIEFAFNKNGTVSGFGVTGDFWGAGAGVEGPTGDTVEERAEVWFDRFAA
ncbi:hypothetical protein GYMLUDRAFT_40239 [Collybiopsis luxurians FD-317 M1]|uniref:Beta-lactamase-related domain-containing protein n=1 Tax=Collybiopsis luxurians FD-317 M1 TaxID=944289 RepID=A0A0D0CW90_9AGAR|nr:hypothetical protein GYMLUDRAFT_40239 [Collybiopsis luxurians FD-317 M1]